MTEDKLYVRIARRETHQSRSTAIVVVLALLVLAAIYVGIEIVLALLGDAPLLVSPSAAVEALNARSTWLPWAGGAAVLFGLIVLAIAVIPARRARHSIAHARMAIVVDDGVLAGSIGAEARKAVGISQDRTRASVSRSKATVSLTPTSGVPISRDDSQRAADRLLDSLNPKPRIRAAVTIATNGMVGS